MDVFKAMETRYSYRGPFTDDNVPREDLLKILQAGCQAPSGANGQTTDFIAVDDPVLLAKFHEMFADRKEMPTAKAVLVCVCDPTPAWQGFSFMAEDCAAAVENMLLAIQALGYATVWLDGVLRKEHRAETIAEWLGVPEEKTIRVILPIGKAVEPGTPREKKPIEERAWFNKYGGE